MRLPSKSFSVNTITAGIVLTSNTINWFYYEQYVEILFTMIPVQHSTQHLTRYEILLPVVRSGYFDTVALPRVSQ